MGIDTSKRIKMTVELDVTIPQGLTLQAMFNHWNRCSSAGASRHISFYVDGDGNFHPNCKVTFSEPVPELSSELEQLASATSTKDTFDRSFDFDNIACKLRFGKD